MDWDSTDVVDINDESAEGAQETMSSIEIGTLVVVTVLTVLVVCCMYVCACHANLLSDLRGWLMLSSGAADPENGAASRSLVFALRLRCFLR